MQTRKIIHLDMDAFYASIEQRDHPHLRGKPVAVGDGSSRGVVAAASYEARKFGVRSAMPGFKAREKCPELIFMPPRFEVYREVSHTIREIFYEYTDLVEPMSLDEAYLDVTYNKKEIPYASTIGRLIKEQIQRTTQLTASAGISYNKFLAKMASDVKKPNGLFVILPEEAAEFLEKLPVEKFHGIGKKTAIKMHEVGIKTGQDLKAFDESLLIQLFGKAGRFYHQIANGQDDRPVEPNRIRKSVSVENTFREDLARMEEMEEQLTNLTSELVRRLQKAGKLGRTINLKVKFPDFKQITRNYSIDQPTADEDVILQAGLKLIRELDPEKPVRLLGIGLSSLEDARAGQQLTLDF